MYIVQVLQHFSIVKNKKKINNGQWIGCCPLFPPPPTPFAQNHSNSNNTSVLWKDWALVSECLFKEYLVKYNYFVLVWDCISAHLRWFDNDDKSLHDTTEGRDWLVWGPQSCRVESTVCSYNTGYTKSLFLKGRRSYFYFHLSHFIPFK